MAVEDYSTYTEEDPNADLSVSAGLITVDTIRRDAKAWVVKDFGAGFFTTPLKHNFDIKMTALEEQGLLGTHMLGTIVGTTKDHVDGGDDAVYVRARKGAGVSTFRVVEVAAGVQNSGDNVTIDVGTQYYCTLEISAIGDYTTKVYSDAARTTVVGSSTVSGTAGLSFRYAYGMAQAEGIGTATASGELAGLEFVDASTTRKTFWGPWYSLHGISRSFGQILPK